MGNCRSEMKLHFFLYGMLMPGSGHPLAEALGPVMTPLGPAAARGSLYAIPDPQGWYPALVRGTDDRPQGTVHGAICSARLEFGPGHLAEMDAFEGFDPVRPDGGDYVRSEIDVEFAGSRMRVSAYLWRVPVPAGARSLPTGRFRDFLALGHAAYRGA